MDSVLSTVAPLFVVATAVGGLVYYTNGCTGKKRSNQASAKQNIKQDNTAEEEDIDELFKPKKKKAAPVPVKLSMPKMSKVLNKQKPVKEKKEKVVIEAPAPVIAPVVVAKPEPKKELTEVEKLRLRVQELENAQKPKPVVAETKMADYNPAPILSQDQLAEQEKAMSKFKGGDWIEITAQTRNKDKKKKDRALIDLNILTVVSALTVTQADRFTIVGDKGQVLKDILATVGTGCKIELPTRPAKKLDNPSQVPMKIEIEGTETQVDTTKKIIMDLINKGYSAILTPDTTEARLRIDPADRSKIVGEKGANIKKITEKTGVTITIPKKEDNDTNNIVHIVGSSQGVAEAKEAIKSLVVDGFSSLTHEDFEKIHVDFPTALRKFLLISNDNDKSLIKKIEQISTCKLTFPQQTERAQIGIVGPSNQVYNAASLVKQVLEKLQRPVNDVFLPGFESNDFTKNELW